MATAVDNTLYNNLPSLSEANKFRENPFVDDAINGPLRDVFLKHAVELTYCLYLQHRHHEVGSDEAVVKVEGTGHLMHINEIDDIASFGNKIVPTTWMTSGGKVLPMELASVPAGTEALAPSSEFLSEFVSVLAANGCQDYFGIDTMGKCAWSELTIGDASVVVPSNDSDASDQNKYIPVAFAFDKKKPGFIVHGRCGTDHKHSSKPKPT